MDRNSTQGPGNEIWWKAILLSNLCEFLRKKWNMLWLTGIFITDSPVNMVKNKRIWEKMDKWVY